MNVECKSRLEPGGDFVQAVEVKAWVADLPDGATIEAVSRDFGTQRDPDVRLVGLRASWSETRHAP